MVLRYSCAAIFQQELKLNSIFYKTQAQSSIVDVSLTCINDLAPNRRHRPTIPHCLYGNWCPRPPPPSPHRHPHSWTRCQKKRRNLQSTRLTPLCTGMCNSLTPLWPGMCSSLTPLWPGMCNSLTPLCPCMYSLKWVVKLLLSPKSLKKKVCILIRCPYLQVLLGESKVYLLDDDYFCYAI